MFPRSRCVDLLSFSLPHLNFMPLRWYSTDRSPICRNIEPSHLRFLKCCCLSGDHNEGFGSLGYLLSTPSRRNLTRNNIKCGSPIPSLMCIVLVQLFVRSYLELITALYEIKHHYLPHSVSTVLFPSLEVLGSIWYSRRNWRNPLGIYYIDATSVDRWPIPLRGDATGIGPC